MTDQHFLQTYATRKDPAAFRHLVETYQGLVYSAAGRRLARQQDIEDVVQLTFLKLAHAAHTIQYDLASWLYSTAVNAANDLIRRDSTRRRHEVQAAMEHAATNDAAERQALHRLLHLVDEAILRLPIDQQHLIVEHFLRGRSQRELAAELGISQATICRRMEGAVRCLREALGKDGLGAAPSMIVLALQHLPQPPVPPILTAQLTKIGLAGAGAKVSGFSLWLATAGTGVKLGVAASIVAVITGGVFVGTLNMQSGKTATVAPAAAAPADDGAAPAPAPVAAAGAPRALPPTAEPPTALVSRIRQAYADLEPYSTAITTTVSGGEGESVLFVRYATDGRRLDLATDRFDRREGLLHHQSASRQVWDGGLFLARTTPAALPRSADPNRPAAAMVATFSQDDRARIRLQRARELGPFLAGYLQGRHVADLLDTAATRPPESVQLDGAACQLIAGTSTLGSFQVWIDDRTSLLRKAVLDQKVGDLYWTQPLPQDLPAVGGGVGGAGGAGQGDALVACHVELADVRIVRVGDLSVPVYGSCTETLTYRSRAPEVLVETAERSDFRHRPDFASLHCFEIDGLSDGQTLTRVRFPKDPPDPATYFWKAGKVTTASGAPLPPVNATR
jgi:RNA polymerase sigma-70 factor (ECF subfamily)